MYKWYKTSMGWKHALECCQYLEKKRIKMMHEYKASVTDSNFTVLYNTKDSFIFTGSTFNFLASVLALPTHPLAFDSQDL